MPLAQVWSQSNFVVIDISVSACIGSGIAENDDDYPRKYEKIETDSLTIYNISMMSNCADNFNVKASYIQDTLLLYYGPEITEVTEDDGTIAYEIMQAMCSCYYKYTYKIRSELVFDVVSFRVNYGGSSNYDIILEDNNR